MKLFSNKAIRLLLAVSVSIWMAGGCLFGCSNTTMGAEVNDESQNSVAAAVSCHAKRSHECCHATKPKPKKHFVSNWHQKLGVEPSFVPGPRGMMSGCPLVVNSTAATSNNFTHIPDTAHDAISSLFSFEKETEHTDSILVVPFLPNRGPTHLRCCVFLI